MFSLGFKNYYAHVFGMAEQVHRELDLPLRQNKKGKKKITSKRIQEVQKGIQGNKSSTQSVLMEGN